MRWIGRSRFSWMLLVSVLCASFLSVSGVQAQSGDLTQTDIDRISRTVVYIESVRGRYIDSTGTGTIISPDGRIYTNRHVAEGATDFRIYLQSEVGELPVFSYYASVVALYDEIDFAVLQIDRDSNRRPLNTASLNLPYLADFGESATIGERVYIFGFPAIGDGYLVVTQGSITSIQNGTLYNQRQPVWYRTDAEMSPGNSGGLVVNMRGQFIGIPTEVRKEDRTLGRLGGILSVSAVQAVVMNRPQQDTSTVNLPTLTITNVSTQEVVCYVYISLTTSTTWGRDWLENATLAAGESATWNIEPGSYDVLLRNCEDENLTDYRALSIDDALTITYPQGVSDTTLAPTPQPAAQPTTAPDTADDDDGLYIEILEIEHNTTVSGRSENGMKIYAYIRAEGYRGVPVRAGVFFFWEDNTPISGENAPVSDRTIDGDLTTQVVLTPAYSDTEWPRYWFWLPYSVFPLGFSGEQAGYAQAYIARENDEFLSNPSNLAEFTIIYPD